MMDNVAQRIFRAMKPESVGSGPNVADILLKGTNLPSYKDIQDAHRVFIESLDDKDPKAVDMLLAAEKLKGMAEQLRVDRDAMSPIHEAISATLGVGMTLSDLSEEDDIDQDKFKETFFDLLTSLTILEREHRNYAFMAANMGSYSERG